MNQEPGHNHEAGNSGLSIARRIGRLVLGMTTTYVGLKVGEDILHFTLPFYVEVGVAAGIGTAVEQSSNSE